MRPEADFGWVYRTPDKPPSGCRWCQRDLVLVRGVVVCQNCDDVRFWPSVQATA